MKTNLTPVYTQEEILARVSILAENISSDYRDRDLVLIGALKGAFIFLSDLVRRITVPVKIDFVGVSSYADQSSSSGKIRLTKSVDMDIEGKDVLIVEDIVDTGLTLVYLIDYLNTLKPNSIKVCALIDKRERRKTSVAVDYAGLSVDEGFLVGYGLDYAENYRNLPGIYHVKL